MNEKPQPGLFIGIDWADQKHDCYVIDRDGKGFHQELKHSPEDIDTWIAEMLKRADGKPIAIMLEQSRGPLVHALMFRDNVLLFPINPKQLARYRESYPGGGKHDPTDAKYLARGKLQDMQGACTNTALCRRDFEMSCRLDTPVRPRTDKSVHPTGRIQFSDGILNCLLHITSYDEGI